MNVAYVVSSIVLAVAIGIASAWFMYSHGATAVPPAPTVPAVTVATVGTYATDMWRGFRELEGTQQLEDEVLRRTSVRELVIVADKLGGASYRIEYVGEAAELTIEESLSPERARLALGRALFELMYENELIVLQLMAEHRDLDREEFVRSLCKVHCDAYFELVQAVPAIPRLTGKTPETPDDFEAWYYGRGDSSGVSESELASKLFDEWSKQR